MSKTRSRMVQKSKRLVQSVPRTSFTYLVVPTKLITLKLLSDKRFHTRLNSFGCYLCRLNTVVVLRKEQESGFPFSFILFQYLDPFYTLERFSSMNFILDIVVHFPTLGTVLASIRLSLYSFLMGLKRKETERSETDNRG